MQWKSITDNPVIIKNYALFKESGLLDFIEELQNLNNGLEDLLIEANAIFQQGSVDELIDLIIHYLAEKFIPSNMVFILNEGIMVNRIKTIICRNMKITNDTIHLDSLLPFEKFLKKYNGTTSFLILESEMGETGFLEILKPFNPEIVVPVLGISGLYGIILFGPKVLGEDYSAREISYIDRLMNFTSIAIQNTIHYEHSVKDSKTGLYNHNFFIHRVNEQIARSKRINKPFSIIVMDIDHFKHFNDTYGHLAGDEVIINLARVLKKTLREGDILSRFGGEEFTVLLPFSDRKDSWIASERFRTEIEKMETHYQSDTLKVTVSLGIATYNSDENLDENNLLRRADQALYQSKNNGRNRSSFYKPELLENTPSL